MGDVPDGQGLIANLIMAAEWAAREAKDKTFYVVSTVVAPGALILLTYLVPAGKTLYIHYFSFAIWSHTPPDSDVNQGGRVFIGDTAIPDVEVGGNGGASMVLPKPLVVVAGRSLYLVALNESGHDCGLAATAGGYEV